MTTSLTHAVPRLVIAILLAAALGFPAAAPALSGDSARPDYPAAKLPPGRYTLTELSGSYRNTLDGVVTSSLGESDTEHHHESGTWRLRAGAALRRFTVRRGQSSSGFEAYLAGATTVDRREAFVGSCADTFNWASGESNRLNVLLAPGGRINNVIPVHADTATQSPSGCLPSTQTPNGWLQEGSWTVNCKRLVVNVAGSGGPRTTSAPDGYHTWTEAAQWKLRIVAKRSAPGCRR